MTIQIMPLSRAHTSSSMSLKLIRSKLMFDMQKHALFLHGNEAKEGKKSSFEVKQVHNSNTTLYDSHLTRVRECTCHWGWAGETGMQPQGLQLLQLPQLAEGGPALDARRP